MGASPGYFVFDPGENDDPFGLMEANSLQCLSVQNAKCLRRVNGELKLKKAHECYYQIQGQLCLTEGLPGVLGNKGTKKNIVRVIEFFLCTLL